MFHRYARVLLSERLLVRVLKLNFEGASKGNPGPSGYGCVMRDSNSKVICAMCSPLGTCNAIKVEVMTLLMGLRFKRLKT